MGSAFPRHLITAGLLLASTTCARIDCSAAPVIGKLTAEYDRTERDVRTPSDYFPVKAVLEH